MKNKITIPTEVWFDLEHKLALWHVEKTMRNPWVKTIIEGEEEEVLSPAAESQVGFVSAALHEILEEFFEKGSWSEREEI
tara:strand:+ start:627 stop:866 length:240 start_codon:yes stop_codon:yes gene_type:complete